MTDDSDKYYIVLMVIKSLEIYLKNNNNLNGNIFGNILFY